MQIPRNVMENWPSETFNYLIFFNWKLNWKDLINQRNYCIYVTSYDETESDIIIMYDVL